MLRAAIIGYGGIAQAAHLPAYRQLEQEGLVKLVAACDIAPERFLKKIDINIGEAQNEDMDITYFTDAEAMLSACDVDLIDICLPTPLHAATAADMLKRGYHVLSEKPMARTWEEAQQMLCAARTSKGRLMIGQCLRFFPEYRYLKQVVEMNEFGRVLSARFSRQSPPPLWGYENWFMDYEKSGGCLYDMHIHDIDMVRYLFGNPHSVKCAAADVYSGKDSVFSQLDYEGFPALVVGDWSLEGMEFRAEFCVAFEHATVVGENGVVTVYPRGAASYQPELAKGAGVTEEIRYFLNIIESKQEKVNQIRIR